MLDLLTLKTAPVPILEYLGDGNFIQTECFYEKDSATEYWLFQSNGETYHLKWWQNGWVVCYQESYLCEEFLYEGELTGMGFRHKNDIPSFEHSHFGTAKGWHHVYLTREDAVEAFKFYWKQSMSF